MKNLEKEYKEQLSHETPDLWSRIEAGVDAYEAAKKESAPAVTETSPDTDSPKIVNFRLKKTINVIGKLSVAAVLIAAVAVTVNLSRTGRQYSASPVADATMSEAPSHEAAQDYSPSEEATAEPEVNPLPAAEAEVSEPPVNHEEASKDATLSPGIESGDKRGEDADEPAYYTSPVTGDETVSVKSIVKTFDISNLDAIKFLSELNNLGLTDIRGLTVTESPEQDASFYGFETDTDSFSVASFTAGSNRDSYLLFYAADTDSGIDILAVKKADESGDFIYSKK